VSTLSSTGNRFIAPTNGPSETISVTAHLTAKSLLSTVLIDSTDTLISTVGAAFNQTPVLEDIIRVVTPLLKDPILVD
jgi:hypothetical protein